MFPRGVIEIICAWHKDVFVNKLWVRTADPGVKIRQIHYVGHGAGGGLYFGYHNAVSAAERTALADMLSRIPPFLVGDNAKRVPHSASTQRSCPGSSATRWNRRSWPRSRSSSRRTH